MIEYKRLLFGCPECCQKGEVVFFMNDGKRTLVRLSDGFHLETGRLLGMRHVIVCDRCDEIDAATTGEISADGDWASLTR